MDINLLVVSVGNSRLAIGVFAEGELRQTARVNVDDMGSFARELGRCWEIIADGDEPVVAGASVNPSRNAAVEQAIYSATGLNVQWIGREVELPHPVRTKNTADTGVDRVLGVAAAYEQLQKACVVVDAGTALTINYCDDKGSLLGGAILPGAAMMLRAMHEHTARLPEVRFALPSGLIGDDTKQAMLHGVFHGIRGAVKELVEQYATTLGTWPEVIVTGGDAAELFGDWELVHAISPDLALYGIALAYANHQIKHGL